MLSADLGASSPQNVGHIHMPHTRKPTMVFATKPLSLCLSRRHECYGPPMQRKPIYVFVPDNVHVFRALRMRTARGHVTRYRLRPHAWDMRGRCRATADPGCAPQYRLFSWEPRREM